MIDKIINNKISWIILGIILIGLSIILFIPNKNGTENVGINQDDYQTELLDDKLVFKLIGEEEITIKIGETYEDPGYVALLNDNTDLSNNVEIKNTIDYYKTGKYEIIYILTYKNIKKELKRIIAVEGINENDINIKLNGNEIIYLNLNEEYVELNAKSTYKNEDISSNIKIESNLDITKVGTYEIKYKIEYQGIEKEAIRKVVVFDIDKLFSVDKENLIINITLSENFSYVRLPSGIVNQNEVISYKVSGTGNYEFIIFTKDYKEYKKIVSVETSEEEPSTPSTDTSSPSGTCEAILKDGKTTVTVKSNSSISKYNYNGVDSNSSIYNVDKYLRESYVTLTGKNGKTKKITCNVKMETLPVIKPSGSVVYSLESATLKIYVVKKDGFYLSYIWVKDAVNQLKKQYTTNSSKKPADILGIAIKNNNLKNKIMIGFNASPPVNSKYWSGLTKYSEYNLREPVSLMIYNGKVLVNDYEQYRVNRQIYYIDGSNQLKFTMTLKNKTVAERKTIFEDIINAGTQNTFSFNSSLVKDGKALDLTQFSDAAKLAEKARRQALCQLDSNNFVLATSINGSSAGSIKRQTLANNLAKLGCITAVNLDGGGSSATFVKKKGTNTLTKVTGGGRELTSVLYFTELN